MQIRIAALEKQVERLDVVLQREMRLLDEAIKGDIESQDTMLQREMDLKDKALDEKLKALAFLVQEIKDEQKQRTSRVYGN